MNETNKVKLGAFLLISLTLLILSFGAAGIGKLFEPKIKSMTVLSTSVEGMTIGSAVKYLGMPVGKITGMAMRGSGGKIMVYFDIFPRAIEEDRQSKEADGKFDRADMERMVSRHQMSCFVNAAGLMGGTFLELTVHNSPTKQEEFPRPPEIDPNICYIPSEPSHIGNAIQNVSRILEELRQIDWNKFSERINYTLDGLSSLLKRNELDKTLKSINVSCGNLETISVRLQQIVTVENVAKVNQSIANLESSSANIDKLTRQKELTEMLGNVNSFTVEATRLLKVAENGAGDTARSMEAFKVRVEQTLTRLDNSMHELLRLAGELNDDPNQLIRGRKE